MASRFALISLLGLLLATALAAVPPLGGDYELIRSTIDNGGGVSSGGNYVLTGSIGQPDANSSSSGGGNFEAAGGFWAQISNIIADLIFENGFE